MPLQDMHPAGRPAGLYPWWSLLER